MCGFGTAPSRPIVYGMEGCWKTSSMLARSTGRPAYMTRMSSAAPATTPRSWVMSTTRRRSPSALGENVEDLRLNRHVEGRGRLVGDDDVGVVRDGDGDHHALTHTTGELVREAAETLLGLRDADQIEQLDATVVNLLLGHVG